MARLKEKFKDPFFRSTVNVMAVQVVFVILTVLVFGFAIWHQQHVTQSIINDRRAAIAAGAIFSPESLNSQIYDLRNDTLYVAFLALSMLALVFGYLSARYALNPTRDSLEYQKRFIGNVAHELRTPIAIIRTNAEVALMDKGVRGYARETLETTIEELDRISGIINNLVSFDSLMRPGTLRLEPLLLRDIANTVVRHHLEMAQKYGIAIAVDAAVKPVYIMGNQLALEQAVTNLVKNALNYTPQHDGRSVIVRIDDLGEEVAISVIDTGIGIARKDLSYIFQPFYRGDTSRERGIGSGTSGLGLAIVHDIVRAHSGYIVIRSALNRGTTIELCFTKADMRDHVNSVSAAEDSGSTEEHEERLS